MDFDSIAKVPVVKTQANDLTSKAVHVIVHT